MYFVFLQLNSAAAPRTLSWFWTLLKVEMGQHTSERWKRNMIYFAILINIRIFPLQQDRWLKFILLFSFVKSNLFRLFDQEKNANLDTCWFFLFFRTEYGRTSHIYNWYDFSSSTLLEVPDWWTFSHLFIFPTCLVILLMRTLLH